MTEKIDVTPNVMRCLEVFREVVKSLPDRDLKTQAEGALAYMEEAATGQPQSDEGIFCPAGKIIIPTGG